MSNIPIYDNDAKERISNLGPEHHTHNSTEPLPGATGGRPGPDYSADNPSGGARLDRLEPQAGLADFGVSETGFGGAQRQDSPGGFGSNIPETGAPTETTSGMQARPAQVNFEDQAKGYDPSGNDTSASAQGKGEMFSSGEMGSQNWKQQGGMGGGQREREPASTATSTTKPSMSDKVAGGAQKYVGKMMNNPNMQEKGELRETGGKPAVSGSRGTGI